MNKHIDAIHSKVSECKHIAVRVEGFFLTYSKLILNRVFFQFLFCTQDMFRLKNIHFFFNFDNEHSNNMINENENI